MIRPTVPADTPTILKLAEGTGVFKPHEVDALSEVLGAYHAGNHDGDHVAIVDDRDGRVVAYAYYDPDIMTDRTWYLYWIAVSKQTQARGVGTRLLHHAENEIKKLGGRILFIETSGLPHYELTRKFYLKHGYEAAATLRDFYTDGDDMVVFRKHF